MTDIAETIPATTITLGVGEPVFPELRKWLTDFPEVLELINQRERYGIAKYGQTLMTGDGRDTATEIATEQADTLAYLQKHIMQHGGDDWIYGLMMQQIELCQEMLVYLDAMSPHELVKYAKVRELAYDME